MGNAFWSSLTPASVAFVPFRNSEVRVTVDWEHHFEADAPAYLQLSMGGLVLHLSEHHGDCCPGSTVFVWMTGVEEYHREITGKGYKYLRPGIETTFYEAKCVQVIDPFGNRIRFNEDLKTATPSGGVTESGKKRPAAG